MTLLHFFPWSFEQDDLVLSSGFLALFEHHRATPLALAAVPIFPDHTP